MAKKFAYLKEVLIGAGAGLVALVLLILGFSVNGSAIKQIASQPSSSASVSVDPSASASPTATAGRTCSIAALATDPLLGTFSGQIINAGTNEVLFDRNGDVPAATASTMKLITAAAAVQILGPNYRVETKVYQDSANPGTIYLVGGGDPTLSRTAPGKQSVYQNAPKLSDLAVGVNAKVGTTPITKIILDSTLFNGPSWEPSWERSEQTQGFMSEVTALEVDGDRANPTAETSARSTNPIGNAGKYFKAALGASASGAVITQGKMPSGTVQIASVLSQPISNWIRHMLLVSDNTEAEYLARLVSLKLGQDGSFTSLNSAMKSALSYTGLNSGNLTIKDGSGLSNNNAVPPSYLAKLSQLIGSGLGNWNVVMQGMPVAHETGSLTDRFGGANLDADGKVIAKTGWIKHGYTLAGLINAKDGTKLVFAVYALGNVTDSAKGAIDNLVTAAYRCGNSLSNN
ncbi:MAG: D-alanyl-D-alanine carboxypeptidase/D-alanyl-D-alanine-endopeptidase [Micrococcales bacterium]